MLNTGYRMSQKMQGCKDAKDAVCRITQIPRSLVALKGLADIYIYLLTVLNTGTARAQTNNSF